MIMRHDDRRGTVCQRIAEYLPRMYRGPVNQTDGHDPDVQDLVRAVYGGAEKVLLLPVGVMAHMREEIGRGLDPRPLRLDAPPCKLQRGLRVFASTPSKSRRDGWINFKAGGG